MSRRGTGTPGDEGHDPINKGGLRMTAAVTGSVAAAPMSRVPRSVNTRVPDSSPYRKESGDIDVEKWQTACRLIV
jgi:hypothetical protein